jgi:hypothetical protein
MVAASVRWQILKGEWGDVAVDAWLNAFAGAARALGAGKDGRDGAGS